MSPDNMPGYADEWEEKTLTKFKAGDKVVLISSKGYNPRLGIGKGSVGRVTSIRYLSRSGREGDGCWVDFEGSSRVKDLWLFNSRLELIDEDDNITEGSTIHNSRTVFLLPGDQEPRCVLATYLASEDAPTTEFKTFDQSLTEGDYVVIPTEDRHKMTVVKITATTGADGKPIEPDLESPKKIDWIVGRVDRSAFEGVTAKEDHFLEVYRLAQKAQRKAEMQKTMFEGLDESMLTLEHKPTVAPVATPVDDEPIPF